MPDKKRSSGGKSKSLLSLLLLIPNILSLVNKVLRIIKEDAQQAGKNIVTIFVLAIMLACLLTSTWVGVLVVLFFCLVKFQLSWLTAAVIVLLFNIVLLLIISMLMTKARHKLFFPKTCKMLSRQDE